MYFVLWFKEFFLIADWDQVFRIFIVIAVTIA